MLHISFKYVGQGDCIIIEWERTDRRGIGIIDCNLFEGRNVAVEHLGRVAPRVVDFIILSHPHRDHYSGLRGLLEHCERRQVPIHVFGHTAIGTKEYLKSVVMSQGARQQLVALYRKANALHDAGLIHRYGLVNDFAEPIALLDGVQLRFLAPSQKDFASFLRSAHHPDLSEKAKTNPNLLSTVTLIEGEAFHIVLTADAERETLRRIGLGTLKRDYRPLLLGQVPHHGSLENHYRAFWRNRRHETGAPLAISVGPNVYGHPSEEVIADLRRAQYKVDLTWTPTTPLSDAAEGVVRGLDVVSTRVRFPEEGRDLNYTFPI